MKLVGLSFTPVQRAEIIKRCHKELKNYNEEEEERRRREACPLYWALFFPETPPSKAASAAFTRKGLTSATQNLLLLLHVDFLQKLLENCVGIAIRRHGSLLEKDPLIMRVFRIIPSIRGNNPLRLAALFLFLWAEPVVVDYLAALYPAGSPELTNFHRIVRACHRATDAMLRTGATIYDVVAKLSHYVEWDILNAYAGSHE